MKDRKLSYFVAGSVALVTFAVYLPALGNGLVELDDAAYIVDNPYIRSLNLRFIRWAFLQFNVANWHPLTWISHAIDYALWGMNPVGHHLTNILLHALNSALVVVLVLKLLGTGRSGSSTSLGGPAAWIAAGVTGLLFGLHPLHVESVAWVAERKDVLCALFFLLSVHQYVSHLRSEGVREDLPHACRWHVDRHHLAAVLFFALALLSKPMAVSLPCVLLVLDWFPFRRIRDWRSFGVSLRRKLPFIGLSLASSVVTVLAQKTGGALVSKEMLPLPGRLLVASRALLVYLENMALPIDLAPYYPYSALGKISLRGTEYLASVTAVLLMTGATVFLARRSKLWFSVWSYYVITLLPVLGIVQVGGQAMADRYTYLPSLGPFLLVGLAAARGYAQTEGRVGLLRFLRRVGLSSAVAVFAALSILTVKQIGIWESSTRLFDAVLSNESRRSPTVYYHRGVAYEKTGQAEKAVEDYTRAIALFPAYYEALFSRATAYERLNRLDLALADYDKAALLNPSAYEAYTNRGLVNKKLGRRDAAISDFERAAAISPSAGKAHLNLGIIRAEDGQFESAIDQFTRAIAADPLDVEAYGNRGIIYAMLGRNEAALKDFGAALEIEPDSAVIHFNRGRLYEALGQGASAVADFREACRLGDDIACQFLRERVGGIAPLSFPGGARRRPETP